MSEYKINQYNHFPDIFSPTHICQRHKSKPLKLKRSKKLNKLFWGCRYHEMKKCFNIAELSADEKLLYNHLLNFGE